MFQRFKSFSVCVIVFMTMISSSFAIHYNFKTLSVEQGLAQSVIHCIYQDSRGFIWLGTDGGGVSKYDGDKFTNFTERNGLPQDRILSIIEDDFGNLWFGTDGGGLSKYDGQKFQTYSNKNGLSGNYIRCITKDKKGNLWVATDKGVSKLVIATNGTISIKPFNESELLTHSKIYTIYLDKSGVLWFGTELNGLYRYDGKYLTHFDNKDGMHNNTVRAILQDKNNLIWLGTDEGVCTYDPNNRQKMKNFEALKADKGFTTKKVTSLMQDKNGAIWIGSYGDGLIKYNKGITTNFTEKDGLSKNYILSMFEDNTGNLWFGTYAGGVSKYDGGIFSNISEKDGLINNIVFSIAEDAQKNLWMGTYNGGLCRYDGKQFKTYINSKNESDNSIYAIEFDKKGNLWYSIYNKGLQCLLYNTSKNDYVQQQVVSELNKLSSIKIISMLLDKNGYLWLGTVNNGVYKVNVSEYPQKLTYQVINEKNGFTNEKVYAIHQDKKGNIWFATNGQGVYILAKNEQNITNTKVEFKRINIKTGMLSNKVISIAEDKYGNIWLGTRGGGISKYYGRHIVNYTTTDGLSSNFIYLMKVDNYNNLWVGYERGVDKIVLNKQFKYTNQSTDLKLIKFYSKDEGFKGLECNGNAVCMDHEGKLWFGTIEGVNVYNAKADIIDNVEAQTHITNIQLFYKDVNWLDYAKKVTNWFSLPEDLQLPHTKNNLTFHFVGINYTYPEKIKYQFQLVGMDNDWSPETKNTQVSYTNLSSGKYKFKVKACNSDGFWNKEPVTFSFEILPPFYNTWWFYLLCISILFSLIYAIIKRRERNLIVQTKLLEEKVTERTIQLQKEKENVEKQKGEIEVKNVQIETQRDLLERKNVAITDSINYAKRIQEAILPSTEFVKSLFSEHFILYEPKDIVSGDFYWFYKRNNKIYFAAVDCTGHGVPGAFMSIVGNNLLEDAIIQNKEDNPAKVLQIINRSISKKLARNTESEIIKDGMDIALCCFDTITNQLDIASAYHILYMIKNYELIEIKGDRVAIDVSSQNTDYDFTLHTFKIEAGDMIYLFSDGYVDQVGGEKRKKFLYQPFKDMLIEIHKLSMENQEDYLKERIKEWQGDFDRIDDVLVMGIKLVPDLNNETDNN